ncbi:MAG: LemA family protein [Candidatus Solibacter usitatus]|nr:LemA family protein [Candidatus Solibacter usitatus]
MKIVLFILGILVIAALITGGKFITVRNELAVQNEAISKAWADVDAVLQRRVDLIPNLVETVKGYAGHEKGVFESVAQSRAAMAGARNPRERVAANAQLESALSRLLVVVEQYPQLKANENFTRLQDELAGTENRIAVERRKYNETVQRYNTTLALFPNNIVASMSGFQRNDAYFKTDPASRVAPKVKF